MSDLVNHPPHYNQHPSGVECIDIVEHFSFNVGNAIKYLWRAGLKFDELEDLKKAAWYINRELERRQRGVRTHSSNTTTAVIYNTIPHDSGSNV
jgi:hypothetical protein